MKIDFFRLVELIFANQKIIQVLYNALLDQNWYFFSINCQLLKNLRSARFYNDIKSFENNWMIIKFIFDYFSSCNFFLKCVEKMINFMFVVPKIRIFINYLWQFQPQLNVYNKQ